MLKTGENIIVQLPMWIEDSSRIEALMLTNSKPGQGSGGISHKLFPPFNSVAPHFRKDGCILTHGFYQDCPFWRIGPSFVLKGSNTDELDFFHMMVHRVGVKVHLAPTVAPYLPLLYFLAHHLARVKPRQQAGSRTTRFSPGEMSSNGSCSPSDVSPLENTAVWQFFLSHLGVFETLDSLP